MVETPGGGKERFFKKNWCLDLDLDLDESDLFREEGFDGIQTRRLECGSLCPYPY